MPGWWSRIRTVTRKMIGRGGSAATGVLAALLAASCCILPLLLILSGVAGAGLMMTAMRWEWLTLPVAVAGLAAAWAMHVRERSCGEVLPCAARRGQLLALCVATVVVVAAMLLRLLPNLSASLVQSLGR